jgi:NAD(P)-dependent dehydrogenase (short-subunit alcohol dehydrogenase family)
VTESCHLVIVGGTSPPGQATADTFAKAGWKVSLLGRSQSELQHSLIRLYRQDLTDEASLPVMFDRIASDRGGVTHLVLCQRYRDSEDAWDGEFRVSLTATRVLLDAFARQPDGVPQSVVILTSPASDRVALEQPAAYHVAKAGLAQLVRYYAVSLGPRGIRVNGVSPGAILKPRAHDFYRSHPELIELYERSTPLGRMGTPEDLAGAIHLFFSSDAGFVTGQVLCVDGGASLHESISLARLAAGFADIPVTKDGTDGT